MTDKNKYIRHMSKVLLLIIIPLSLILVICSYVITYSSKVAYASTVPPSSDEKERRIYDQAGLLTDGETEELENLCKEYEEKLGIEIFLLTHKDKKSSYPERYIEDFEDQLPMADRVYFLYDVYRGEIFMEGYGLAEIYIHSKRIDKIFDMMIDDLKNGNYFTAFETYIIQSAAYMEDDSELNYDHNYIYDNPPEGFDPDNEYSYEEYDYEKHYRQEQAKHNIFLNVWFQLFASFAIGGIVVAALAYNSGGRMTTGAKDYLDRSRFGLIGRKDQYIRSSVTKIRRPSSDSGVSGGGKSRGGFNAGGFRGGISGGGRSHSSGGRKL